MDHMETVRMGADGHRLASNDVLIRAFTKAGAADGVRIVLYGDSPMATGWVNTALIAIGHGDDVSWLDGGIALWQSEHRPVSTTAPQPGAGPLTARPAPDFIVDAAWVRSHLKSPTTRVLDAVAQAAPPLTESRPVEDFDGLYRRTFMRAYAYAASLLRDRSA